jgi:hypothetical protein
MTTSTKPGRKPFHITKNNMDDAREYLFRKFASENTTDMYGWQVNRCVSPDELQEWCTRELSKRDWERLKTALIRRKARSKRAKVLPKATIQGALHTHANYELQRIVEQYAVHGMKTLSDAVMFLGWLHDNQKHIKVDPSVWEEHRPKMIRDTKNSETNTRRS